MNARDRDFGRTAPVQGRAGAVQLLLARGARIDAVTTGSGSTALTVAVSAGRNDVAWLLTAHGAHVNAKSKDGTTALGSAKHKSDERLAQLLEAHGAAQ